MTTERNADIDVSHHYLSEAKDIEKSLYFLFYLRNLQTLSVVTHYTRWVIRLECFFLVWKTFPIADSSQSYEIGVFFF